MNACNIISCLRRGYFIFPSGMFEKRIGEIILSKNNNSSLRGKDTCEKCRRFIDYVLCHRKFPDADIKGFEHIHLDNDECLSILDQQIVKSLAKKFLERITETLKKIIDQIFGINHIAIENKMTKSFLGNSITINQDFNNPINENNHILVSKCVVYRPTWPPKSQSKGDPTDSNNSDLNNHNPHNKKTNKKSEKKYIQPVIVTATSTPKEDVPPISIDYRIMLEPHIDIYDDKKKETTLVQSGKKHTQPLIVSATSSPKEDIPLISIDYRIMLEPHIDIYDDQEKYNALVQNKGAPINKNVPITVSNSASNEFETIRIDLTLNSDTKEESHKQKTKTEKLEPFDPIEKKTTLHVNESKISKHLKSTLKSNLQDYRRQNITKHNQKTITMRQDSLKEETKVEKGTLNKGPIEMDPIEKEMKFDEDKSKAFNIGTENIDPFKFEKQKLNEERRLPVEEKTNKLVEDISETTYCSLKPMATPQYPLKGEPYERKELKKADKWKYFENIAVPVSALQESPMPNLINYDIKLEVPKLDKLDPLQGDIKRDQMKTTTNIKNNEIKPVETSHITTDKTMEPEIHENNGANLIAQDPTNAKVEKSDNNTPKLKTTETLPSSENVTIFAACPVPENSNHFINGSAAVSFAKNKSLGEKKTCKNGQVERREATNESEKSHLLDSEKELVLKNELKPNPAIIASDPRTVVTKEHMENFNLDYYKFDFLEESETINLMDDNQEHADPAVITNVTVNSDNKKKDVGSALMSTETKTEVIEPSIINSIKESTSPTLSVADWSKIKDTDENRKHYQELLTPKCNPEYYINETYTTSCKNQNNETTQPTSNINYTPQWGHYLHSPNMYQQSCQTYFFSHAEQKRHQQQNMQQQQAHVKEFFAKPSGELNDNFSGEFHTRPAQVLETESEQILNAENLQELDAKPILDTRSNASQINLNPNIDDQSNMSRVQPNPVMDTHSNRSQMQLNPIMETPSNINQGQQNKIQQNLITDTLSNVRQVQHNQMQQKSITGIQSDVSHMQTNTVIGTRSNMSQIQTNSIMDTRSNMGQGQQNQMQSNSITDTWSDTSQGQQNQMPLNPFVDTRTLMSQVHPHPIMDTMTNTSSMQPNPIIDTQSNQSQMKPEKVISRGTRSRAEILLKKIMPVETSVQRKLRYRQRHNLHDSLPQPSNALEKEVPLSVLLERARKRNRMEYCQLNERLTKDEKLFQRLKKDELLFQRMMKDEQLYQSLREREQNSSKKSGRGKSPPSSLPPSPPPSCPSSEPPRCSPSMSFSSTDSSPKFCQPKKTVSKFFDPFLTLSVYDNDNPNERTVKAGKRRELEKRLLGEKGLNHWIFVEDRSQPLYETENVLEYSTKQFLV